MPSMASKPLAVALKTDVPVLSCCWVAVPPAGAYHTAYSLLRAAPIPKYLRLPSVVKVAITSLPDFTSTVPPAAGALMYFHCKAADVHVACPQMPSLPEMVTPSAMLRSVHGWFMVKPIWEVPMRANLPFSSTLPAPTATACRPIRVSPAVPPSRVSGVPARPMALLSSPVSIVDAVVLLGSACIRMGPQAAPALGEKPLPVILLSLRLTVSRSTVASVWNLIGLLSLRLTLSNVRTLAPFTLFLIKSPCSKASSVSLLPPLMTPLKGSSVAPSSSRTYFHLPSVQVRMASPVRVLRLSAPTPVLSIMPLYSIKPLASALKAVVPSASCCAFSVPPSGV